MEQFGNKKQLTLPLSVYTNTPCMGRPPKPKNERRSKLFPLRLTPGEIKKYEAASRRLGEPVAEIFRKGADLYIERDKDGPKRKEKKS